jgi:mannonate dehydratase
MKIGDAKAIVCCLGRNFVTLQIVTEEGSYGLGDATLNGRELAVAAYLNEHLVPLLIGRDARRIEDTWHYFYKGAYWRRGPVTMSAIAAVDTALWDLKAKSLGVPLYQLLGGASRESVLVYGHASGKDLDDTVRAVAHYLDLGYKAIRAQSGIPGLAGTYGVGTRGMYYDPAEKDAPPGKRWSSEHHLKFCPVSVCSPAKRIWSRRPPASRRASSHDSDRGRPPRQRTRALSSVLARGCYSGRVAGEVPEHPPAHNHASRRR